MMINCPKCNLLQPKDQYCANCGINMASWKPPKKPFIKKLISNWIFQLCVLLAIVIFLVLRDSFSGPSTITETPPPDFKQRSQQRPQASTDNNFAAEKDNDTIAQKNKSQKKRFEKLGVQRGKKLNLNSPDGEATSFNNRINAKIFLVPRQQIDNLLSQGQKVDDGIGHISKKIFKQISQTDKKDWNQSDSIQKSFDINKPKILFSGERSSDIDQNIGFYFEVTVFDTNDSQNISLELKAWNELKTGSGQEDALSIELTMPKNNIAIISGIVSRDHAFSEEDRAFFDSSSSLRILNNENFIDDYSEIILVLELN